MAKPQTAKANWFVGVADLAAMKQKLRELAKQHHPDRPGGSEEKMKEINVEYEYFCWLKVFPVKAGAQQKAYSAPEGNPFARGFSGFHDFNDIFEKASKARAAQEKHAREQAERMRREEKAKAQQREPDASWFHDFMNDFHAGKGNFSGWRQEPHFDTGGDFHFHTRAEYGKKTAGDGKRYYKTAKRTGSDGIFGGFYEETRREDIAWPYYEKLGLNITDSENLMVENFVRAYRAMGMRDRGSVIGFVAIYLKDKKRFWTRALFFFVCRRMEYSIIDANELAYEMGIDKIS